MSAVGPFGLALMGPTESVSENGGRYIINFPFFELQQGSTARKGTVGENQRVRLVNIDFEGLYAGRRHPAARVGRSLAPASETDPGSPANGRHPSASGGVPTPQGSSVRRRVMFPPDFGHARWFLSFSCNW